jgi:hypothetical protein
MRNTNTVLFGHLERRDHLKNMSFDGRMVFKLNALKWSTMVWSVFIWLRLGPFAILF